MSEENEDNLTEKVSDEKSEDTTDKSNDDQIFGADDEPTFNNDEFSEETHEQLPEQESEMESSLEEDDNWWMNLEEYELMDEMAEYEYELDEDEELIEGGEQEFKAEHKPHEADAKKVAFSIVEDTEHLGGDFTKSTTNIMDKRYDKVYDFDHEEEEEEVIEEEHVVEEMQHFEEEEEQSIIDRENLYEIYHRLYPGYNSVKIRNNFLQKKMVEYFSKRKMDHVMKEDANYEDNYNRYCKKLEVFCSLKIETQKTKDQLIQDIHRMREEKQSQAVLLLGNLNKMYAREKEIGTGLIMAKTGKQIPEKLVERLVRNQMLKTEEMSKLRLHYIKIRDKIAELEAACAKLDKIGDHFTIMDYEQLKIERRNHTDKIEERDEELSRLRRQCLNAIQCLAHTREKLSAVQDRIYLSSVSLQEVERERFQIREVLNANKKQRDSYRMSILKLKENAGLLTKPKLLRDMEDTIHERDRLQAELEHLRATITKYKNQIECINSHLKKNAKNLNRKKPGQTDDLSISSGETRDKKTTANRKPSLLTVKESVCDDFLQSFFDF